MLEMQSHENLSSSHKSLKTKSKQINPEIALNNHQPTPIDEKAELDSQYDEENFDKKDEVKHPKSTAIGKVANKHRSSTKKGESSVNTSNNLDITVVLESKGKDSITRVSRHERK